MKATLLSLGGKYYGTKIEIEFDDDNQQVTEQITLWNNGDGTPSDRELEKAKVTRKQLENNEVIENSEFYGEIRAQEKMERYDDHFESQSTYLNALALVDAINKAN